MLAIQLWNANIGTLDLVTDPDGITEIEKICKRSKNGDGVFFEITIDLKFLKEGRDYIESVYEREGIEGTILVNVYEYDPNNWKPRIYYNGKIALKRYIKTKLDLKTHIEQLGFEIKVTNLVDVDVDMGLLESQSGSPIPQTPTEDISFHPKKIIKVLDREPLDDTEYQQLDIFEFDINNDPVEGGTVFMSKVVYAQIDFGNVIKSELNDSFSLPFGFLPFDNTILAHPGSVSDYITFLSANLEPRNPIYVATEAGLSEVYIRLRLKPSAYSRNDGADVDICGEGSMGRLEVLAWFEHRDSNDNIITLENIGVWDSVSGCGTNQRIGSFETKSLFKNNVDIGVGDKIYVYMTYRVWGNYEQPQGVSNGHVWHEFRLQADLTVDWFNYAMTRFAIASNTEFPTSVHTGTMIFEAFNKICQYMTDQPVAFESEFFGRTDTNPTYPADGPGSLNAIVSGGHLRKLLNAKQFLNFTDLFESASARWCLGWGIKRNNNGVQVIYVEPKEKFYDKNLMILELGCVSDLEESVAMEYYYNQVEVGYPKLDVGQLNGLDEFNTLRRVRPPITQTNSKLIIASKLKASGYEIETQRRLIGSTKDSKLDDANFLVSVVRDGGGFKTEDGTNFPFITNLYDPQTAYNLRHTPLRMVRSWLKVLASNVTKFSNKILKFTYGDGNYNLVSRETSEPGNIAENGDIDMAGVEPIWIPERFKFTHPLSRDQMKLISNQPLGYIRFRDEKNNQKDGFILSVRHKPEDKMGDFELLRVYRK